MRQHSKRAKNMKRQSAIALIDVLVLIAIITILSAMLFPVFAAARETARQSSCESNMKHVQYSQDYDIKFLFGNTAPWGNHPSSDTQARDGYGYANGCGWAGRDLKQHPGLLVSGRFDQVQRVASWMGQRPRRKPKTTRIIVASMGLCAKGSMPYGTLPMIKAGTGVRSSSSNYLAADGHVKWLLGSKVSGGYGESTSSSFVQDGVNQSGGYAPCSTGSLAGA